MTSTGPFRAEYPVSRSPPQHGNRTVTLDDEADAVLASRYARQEELITLVAKRTMLTAVVALLATPFLFLGWLVWLVVQPAPTLAEATASGHEGRIADAINRTFQEEKIGRASCRERV